MQNLKVIQEMLGASMSCQWQDGGTITRTLGAAQSVAPSPRHTQGIVNSSLPPPFDFRGISCPMPNFEIGENLAARASYPLSTPVHTPPGP